MICISHFIYALDYGDGAGSAHNLYQIDLNNNPQSSTLISSGGNGSGGTGFFVPTGIYPVPNDSNDVYISDEQQVDVGLTLAHGTVWKVQLAVNGTQTAVARGSPDLDKVAPPGDTKLGNPVDLAVNSSGQIVVLNTGNYGYSPYLGSVVTYDSTNGQQVLAEGGSIGSGADSIEIGDGYYGSQTIFVASVYEGSGSPAHITAISGGSQHEFSPSTNYLDVAGGMAIWNSAGGSGDAPTTTTTGSPSASLLVSQIQGQNAIVAQDAANLSATIRPSDHFPGKESPIPTLVGSERLSFSWHVTDLQGGLGTRNGREGERLDHSGMQPLLTAAEMQSLLESLVPT